MNEELEALKESALKDLVNWYFDNITDKELQETVEELLSKIEDRKYEELVEKEGLC